MPEYKWLKTLKHLFNSYFSKVKFKCYEIFAGFLKICLVDFRNQKMLTRSRWFILAFDVSLTILGYFLISLNFFFDGVWDFLTGLFVDTCAVTARKIGSKFRFYGWVRPFNLFRLAKLWLTFFEEFAWRFWFIWRETVYEVISISLQVLAFLRLLLVLKWVAKWAIDLFAPFLRYGRLLGWGKFFLSMFIWIAWLFLINVYLFYLCWLEGKKIAFLCWVEYKKFKKAYKKKIKYLRGWKKRARKVLLSYYATVMAPLKFCWSLINWERQPAKFIWAFYSAFSEKLYKDTMAIKNHYIGLYEGIYEKFFYLLFPEDLDRGGAREEGVIPFFFWLTYYLTIIANGVYAKYLYFKFIFFSLKYLWSWAFFLIDFPLKYLFKGTIIYWLHSVTIKLVYHLVNFFIFYGLPNILSISKWVAFGEFLNRQLELLPYKIEAFYARLARRVRSIYFFFLDFRYNVLLIYFALRGAFSSTLNWLKQKKSRVKKFFRKRYVRALFIYNVRRIMYSKKGRLFWKKIYKPRVRFWFKNVKEKSLKFCRGLISNQIKYRLTKLKLFVNKEFALKAAFWKYRIAVFLDWKIHYHKVIIIYCKLVRFISFICLTFVSLLINIQCFYFAMRGKFNEFYIHNGYEKELYNANLAISQLEDKIEQDRKSKLTSKIILGKGWWTRKKK